MTPLIFNLGIGELVLIAAVALLIFGGERLPDVMKKFASALKRIGRGVDEVRKELGDDIGKGE